MARSELTGATLLLALGLAVPAGAVSPGPVSRAGLLGDVAGGTCSNSPDPQLPVSCIADADCDLGAGNQGQCSVEPSDVVVRGTLTMIVDKDAAGWNDTSFVPETVVTNGLGDALLVPSDPSHSTLTLLLEFTRNGRRFGFAETFQDLGDWFDSGIGADCRAFCVPGWREPITEEQARDGVAIAFAVPGGSMRDAVLSALGLPAGATPYLRRVDATELSDHSAEQDTIGTVLRMKVDVVTLVPRSQP